VESERLVPGVSGLLGGAFAVNFSAVLGVVLWRLFTAADLWEKVSGKNSQALPLEYHPPL